ncbi:MULTISPECIES: caspase family protein [unclassified Bradyrhizobium]|uniref:NADase-type glycan-binding domain-containing protein n=1 Tax=unclassified Bradyrhizobium TaxID=2631580 RepID=UPI001CD6BD06|nr:MULTISPECIES: caspase family protein [unclassified Bradyrhizobium]MCA1376302.1 caspase family protein [Bradyrhizobium sp. IC4060]MCA1487284.1 caspase family protein [Bradyrhizobium sp. IC4061]
MAGLATPAWAEKRVALVIGNDLYPNLPADRQLKKAANDATTVADALRSLGFDIVLGTNLGRQGMIDRLADFTSRLEPGDTAAVFYAGHGVAIAGVNYLVPSDVPTVNEGAEARVRGASIAEPDVIAELQAKAVRVAFVVIDACRDNPFPRAAGRSIGNTRGLADARPARGIFTLYSAGIGQTALDQLGSNDTAHNSVFTRIFVEQLKRPELHLGDLAVEVRERVAALALTATDAGGQAAPHEQTPTYYDQTLGGRIFLWNAESSNGAPKVAGMLVKPPARPAVAERATMRPPRPSAAGESCARSGFETYCVSSMLKPQFGNSYGAANLFDASTGTAWVEGASGNGVGEWITIEFETVRRVRSIHVHNGYQKSPDIFAKNNRVRQIRVLFSGGESQTFVLDDKLSAQLLMLRPPVSAHWMQFIIDDVWAGNKYTDTAITKLLVNSDPVQ